jgi:hypothetical protein
LELRYLLYRTFLLIKHFTQDNLDGVTKKIFLKVATTRHKKW